MHSVHSLPPCPFRCCADSVASLPKRPPKANPETSRDSLPHREDGCRLFAKSGERGHERRGEDEDEAASETAKPSPKASPSNSGMPTAHAVTALETATAAMPASVP